MGIGPSMPYPLPVRCWAVILIEVEIHGELKFIHCADIHLNAFKENRNENYAETRRGDTKFFLKILNRVKTLIPTFFLSPGLYEHHFITRKPWIGLMCSFW